VGRHDAFPAAGYAERHLRPHAGVLCALMHNEQAHSHVPRVPCHEALFYGLVILTIFFLLFFQAWSNGGYSDDMIAAAVMSQKGLKIRSPNNAVFLQPIEHDISWSRFWNYLCR
jgi:hypothetical protein